MVTAVELADPGNYYFWVITTSIALAVLGILKGKIQMLVTITSFAYPNAKFNAMGNDYVKKLELEALMEARSFQDATGILATKNYPLKESKNANNSEALLNEYSLKSLQDILQDIPPGLQPLVKAYLKKYEVGIIKRVLRSRLIKTSSRHRTSSSKAGKARDKSKGDRDQLSDFRPVGDVTSDLISQMLDAERADEIADLFARTPFGKELRDAIHEYDGNFYKIENILDKYVFHELRLADEKVSKTVAEPTRFFVNHLLDVANIKLLLRAKRKEYDAETSKNLLFPPGQVLSTWKLEQMCEASNVTELITELEGTKYYPVLKDHLAKVEKTGEVSPLETALDKYLLKLVIEIAIQYTTTAGPTIRYMISREYETRNLNTILHGLEERLGHKRIMPLTISEEDQ